MIDIDYTPPVLSDEQREKRRAANRAWRARNPEKRKELARRQNEKRREAVREYQSRPDIKERRLRMQQERRAADPAATKAEYRRVQLRKYGLTPEQYELMFESQGRRCVTCQITDTDRWCVDHCHTTLKVRGILCHKCNATLGMVNDTTSTLQAMINYLEKHRGN